MIAKLGEVDNRSGTFVIRFYVTEEDVIAHKVAAQFRFDVRESNFGDAQVGDELIVSFDKKLNEIEQIRKELNQVTKQVAYLSESILDIIRHKKECPT